VKFSERIYFASRDNGFLWKSVVAILAHCFLFALLLQVVGDQFRPATSRLAIAVSEGNTKEIQPLAIAIMQHGSFSEAVRALSELTFVIPPGSDEAAGESNLITLRKVLSKRPQVERAALEYAWTLLMDRRRQKNETPGDVLSQLAEALSPAPLAAGILAESSGDPAAALAYLAKETTAPYDHEARSRILRLHDRIGNTQTVRKLIEDPQFFAAASLDLRMRSAAEKGHWGKVWVESFSFVTESRDWTIWLVTLVAALVWIVLLLRLANATSLSCSEVWIALAAFALGAMSANTTLVAVYWQDIAMNIREDGTFLGDLLYYVAGVGAREEILKLAFAVPVLLFLIKDPDDRRVLLAGGMAGLGFAAQENLMYVASGTAGTAFARFLSANFLHIGLTALTAKGLMTWFRHPTRGWDQALFIITAAILMHGGYNLLIVQPALAEYSIFAMTIIVVIGFWYFHEVRLARKRDRDIVALNALFVWGLTLILGVGYIACAWENGLGPAFQIMLATFLVNAVLMFLFFREFDRT